MVLVAAATPDLVSLLELFGALLPIRYSPLSFTKTGKVCCSVGEYNHTTVTYLLQSLLSLKTFTVSDLFILSVWVWARVCTEHGKHVETRETACWSHFSPATSLLVTKLGSLWAGP